MWRMRGWGGAGPPGSPRAPRDVRGTPQPNSSGLPLSANPGGRVLNTDAQNDGQMTVRRSWKVSQATAEPHRTGTDPSVRPSQKDHAEAVNPGQSQPLAVTLRGSGAARSRGRTTDKRSKGPTAVSGDQASDLLLPGSGAGFEPATSGL